VAVAVRSVKICAPIQCMTARAFFIFLLRAVGCATSAHLHLHTGERKHEEPEVRHDQREQVSELRASDDVRNRVESRRELVVRARGGEDVDQPWLEQEPANPVVSSVQREKSASASGSTFSVPSIPESLACSCFLLLVNR
jgi:hypothetical protein